MPSFEDLRYLFKIDKIRINNQCYLLSAFRIISNIFGISKMALTVHFLFYFSFRFVLLFIYISSWFVTIWPQTKYEMSIAYHFFFDKNTKKIISVLQEKKINTNALLGKSLFRQKISNFEYNKVSKFSW